MSNKDYGLYRNCRHEMARFLKEEKKYKNALSIMAEVAFVDLSGVDNNFDPEMDISIQDFFPYENSLVRIAPGIVSEIFDCQKELGFSDSELKNFLLDSMEQLKLPMRIFTPEESVRIVFLERDQNTEELKRLYSNVKQRFRKKYLKRRM